jgi:hypothetical protein
MSTGYDAMWDSVTDPGDDFWPPVISGADHPDTDIPAAGNPPP